MTAYSDALRDSLAAIERKEGARWDGEQFVPWEGKAMTEADIERVVKIIGATFCNDDQPAGFTYPSHVAFEDCVFFRRREDFEAWIKTPDGVAWQERREARSALTIIKFEP